MLYFLVLLVLLFVPIVIILCSPCLRLTKVYKNDSNICDICEKDADKILSLKDDKDIALVRYAKKVVFKCCCIKHVWGNDAWFFVYLVRNSRKKEDTPIDVEMDELVKPETTGKINESI